MKTPKRRISRRCAAKLLLFVYLLFIGRVSTDSTPSVALVALCRVSKSREKQFLQAITSWLDVRGLSEIVIVDWDSELPIADTLTSLPVNSLNRANVQLVQISYTTSQSWRIAAAFNAALDITRCDLILKVDTDTLLAPDFLERNELEPLTFRYADWRHAKDKNERHLNGVFLAHTSHLRAVAGMDERFSRYGWDDSDLYERLERYLLRMRGRRARSCTACDFKRTRTHSQTALISHIPHIRQASRIDEQRAICFNRSALKFVPPWSQDSHFKLLCGLPHRNEANFTSRICVGSRMTQAIETMIQREQCIQIARSCGYSISKTAVTGSLEIACQRSPR